MMVTIQDAEIITVMMGNDAVVVEEAYRVARCGVESRNQMAMKE